MSATPGEQWDVLVIGAGISGLAAAGALQAEGYKVLVLEARERLGGRVWSRTINKNKAVVDFGASWLHGIKNNPLYPIVKSKKIATLRTDYDNETDYSHGKELSDKHVDAIDASYESWYKYQASQGSHASTDVSLGSTVAAYAAKKGLSASQLDELWYSVHASVECEYAASVFKLSLKNWDQDDELVGGDVLFPGGLSQVVPLLAHGLTIRTSTPVTAITYSTSHPSVKLTTRGGASYAAKAVVVTIPVGVLKAGGVRFTPPLPAAKAASIGVLQMGLLQKVVLVFPEVFWDATEWIGRVPAAPKRGRWAQILNLNFYYKVPMLMCFNAGEYAWEAERSMTDQQFSAAAMEALREMYGSDIPAPTEVHVSRWGSDPYSLGAYSALGVGAAPRDRTTLAQPVGKSLFFAGEATHLKYPSTVHGAYLSGQRAAKEVKAAGVSRGGTQG